MKKQHFFIVLLFALAAIIISNRPRYATTWAATNSNEMVTRAALLDAVNNGVFTANTTIPNDDECVTREQAQAYVNINAITGYDMNELVPKSAFVAATVYYQQPIYAPCTLIDGTNNVELLGYVSSSEALTHTVYGAANIYTIYNRPLEVGDEILLAAGPNDYPVILNTPVATSGSCTSSYGYWIYSVSQNAAIRVTATNSARQYVLEIAYPSGTTNVTICLIVDIAGNTATVQAQSSTAVNTDVSVDWNYTINGVEAIGSPFTISNGNTTSSVQNINNGSTINTMVITINGFSPSSNGTQNYISGGQCN